MWKPAAGDDGAGWEVASRLAATIPKEAAHFMTVHQLTPELAEPVSEAGLVIFIDAADGENCGTWRSDEVKLSPMSGNSLGHHFDVSALLAYSQAIFHSSPQAFVVSVAAKSFEFQNNLTPAVEALLPDVVNYIRKKIVASTN